ncbi:hypothetical protein Tco_0462365 [Tanacetum coccineum]
MVNHGIAIVAMRPGGVGFMRRIVLSGGEGFKEFCRGVAGKFLEGVLCNCMDSPCGDELWGLGKITPSSCMITTAKRISTVRRIKMKIAYQDYLRDKVILYGIHMRGILQSQHQTAMRYKRRCRSLIPVESNLLPHAHAQTTKTYYKHKDLRIKKAQEFKTKTSIYSDTQDLPFKIFKVYQGDC